MDGVKLLVAVVQDQDSANFVTALTQRNYRVTIISSTGGLLRNGSTTLVCGVEDWRVDEWLAIASESCQRRMEPLILSGDPEFFPWYSPDMIEVEVGGANVFIVDIERLERL
jgi:uncharacterized protein YaaQ